MYNEYLYYVGSFHPRNTDPLIFYMILHPLAFFFFFSKVGSFFFCINVMSRHINFIHQERSSLLRNQCLQTCLSLV